MDTDESRALIDVFVIIGRRGYGSVEQYLIERREQCEDQGYSVVFLNDEDVKGGDEHIRGLIEGVHQR